ncbi:MAG: hypothetical protein KGI71_05040 [Patescibacteria group bacterium]|nr:hypothetical protein [Patescibacteria group bacterium]
MAAKRKHKTKKAAKAAAARRMRCALKHRKSRRARGKGPKHLTSKDFKRC